MSNKAEQPGIKTGAKIVAEERKTGDDESGWAKEDGGRQLYWWCNIPMPTASAVGPVKREGVGGMVGTIIVASVFYLLPSFFFK